MEHVVLFALCTFGLFALPLVPALVEFITGSDAEPLKVVQEYDNDPQYFAKGFRQYVRERFPSLFPAGAAATTHAENINDRTKFHVIADGGKPAFTSQESAQGKHYRLLLSHAPVSLPDNFSFEKELYCTKDLQTGRWNQFRALLGEANVVLDKYSTVFRWIHSGASLQADEGCMLYGRVTADKSITLLSGTRFERLNAPVITFGAGEPAPAPAAPDKLIPITRLGNVTGQFENYTWVKGNLDIPRQSSFSGNLIVSGNVTIGSGSRIEGSIKSQGNIHINSGADIRGALFSTDDISIADHCTIGGPVVAADGIAIGTGTIIGKAEEPSTVNARYIAVMENVTAFGTVWATEQGSVEEKQA